MTRKAYFAIALLALSGCATPAYVPGYDTDREDAQLAASRPSDEKEGTARADRLAPKMNGRSVVVSTIVGSIPGLAAQNPLVLISGAVSGGVSAGNAIIQKHAGDHTRIERNCLIERGHKVIDEKG